MTTTSGKAPTTTEATPAPLFDRPTARKAVWAALVGSSLEAFDFYVFAYFSAIFAPALFFPDLDPAAGLLGSFAVIAVAFIVRPIGAAIFGNLGDRIGRKRTLLITITIMGVATGLIGLLPDFATIGIAAPLLLLLLRIAQGLSLGGEWGGGILIAVEHAEPKRRGLYAALPQLGSPVGTILTGALLLILPTIIGGDAMLEWGWRIPFLLAFPLLAVSLYLRLAINETPVFTQLVVEKKRERIPVLAAFRKYPVAILVAVGAAMLGIGSYSLMNTYTIGYGISVLGFSYPDLALATLIGSLLQLVTIPLFGVLANHIGPARVVVIGAIGTLLIAFPMYFLLQFATFQILVGTMIIGGILPTLAWAGLGGLMANIFGGPVRYSAMSIAYAVAAALSGIIPFATQGLSIATDGAWWHPGVVLAIISAITLVCASIASRWTRAVDADPILR
ncbi:MFS transporter [Salinibacterium sp. G-O1]|uniref:MFS transporter n=1 Tax=Salinibacterium sp. G-O1 TaxID=3046208 RepID=UPI0024B8F715|nr:MFS transporter [Salinibacterium sp. G-O1]MDJ0335501.1 MFS transporter [Salinibacterium sp. G-O1]